MTFRTPNEAVQLANNTPYGLAASVWTDNINLALDIAPKLKSGVVWINSTNQFDAAAGFGGYRESGFGREGGREGMYEYLVQSWTKSAGTTPAGGPPRGKNGAKSAKAPNHSTATKFEIPPIDRSPKLFIGGKQTRPDGGYSRPIRDAAGTLLGEVGEGNRKDIRNAVAAANAAAGWSRSSAHLRAQILYYIAENLSTRSDEFVRRIDRMTGLGRGAEEVDATIKRLFTYAAWADKYDGAVHSVPIRGVALAMNEPIGVIGIASPTEWPLLGFVSLVAPAVATGNTVVAIPSERFPLAATDFYSVLETSDLPDGVINIVTGDRDLLATVLAEHDEVEAMWYWGTREGATTVERASAANMKRTWAEWNSRDWLSNEQGEGREFLRRSTQVKNIWIPYGE
jgi:aldehyde dehydrogenase (NAD+)